MKKTLFTSALLLSTAAVSALADNTLYLKNSTAYIPSQCYTKTEDTKGKLHNPCYTCHTRSVQPNYTNDDDLQLEYSFPEAARKNPWVNLFEDRRPRMAQISDSEILQYVAHDNYRSGSTIVLRQALAHPPQAWDSNGNGRWDGYTPDCWFNFDAAGFDHAPDGTATGWRSFSYYPLPATFWPTNGSADDVMIRLPQQFRTDKDGRESRLIHTTNLAIVEAVVRQRDVAIPPTDEKAVGADLDQNGTLSTATTIRFLWPAKDGRGIDYVGAAQGEKLAGGLFPVGTEFLHSVRYLQPEGDSVGAAPRMKELRYMKKRNWQTYADLEDSALEEIKEGDDFPDRASQYIGSMEQGINNGTGWLLQGFIEDKRGELRPQSFEETVFCMGCHGGIGITTDSVFSFPRKFPSSRSDGGWAAQSAAALHNLPEPILQVRGGGAYYEYSYYLMQNHSGSEFRTNDEVQKKFFHPDGSVKKEELALLHNDVSRLLLPSHSRALALDKAYRTIVEDQDFVDGRDANFAPVDSVHKKTEEDQPTKLDDAISTDRFGTQFDPQFSSQVTADGAQ